MSKDIKKALEHCIEWNCVDCPNREELGSGETVCRGRLLTDVLEYVADLEAKLAESEDCNNMLNKCLTEKDIEIEKQKEENAELKQQLVEKEKFFERIMSGEYIPANIAEKSLKLSNQTAIAELEKVKKLLVEKMKLASDKLDCAYYINQQINELKGE